MSMLTLANTPVSNPQSERLGQTVGVVAGAMVAWGQLSPGLGVPADDLTPFAREKAAFIRQLPSLRHLTGQFVAVHGGRVVVSGESRNSVLRQFFADHPVGDSVYIGFIGRRPIARVSAPVFIRRGDRI